MALIEKFIYANTAFLVMNITRVRIFKKHFVEIQFRMTLTIVYLVRKFFVLLDYNCRWITIKTPGFRKTALLPSSAEALLSFKIAPNQNCPTNSAENSRCRIKNKNNPSKDIHIFTTSHIDGHFRHGPHSHSLYNTLGGFSLFIMWFRHSTFCLH